jgi:hypothetical protein
VRLLRRLRCVFDRLTRTSAAQPDAAVALRAHGARRSLYHPRRGVAPPPSAALAGGVFAAAACSAAGRACAEAAASELRGMAEACDTPDGIHVTLAAGGGAGAGLGTLLLQELEARAAWLVMASAVVLLRIAPDALFCHMSTQLEVGRMPTMVHALFPSAVHGACACVCAGRSCVHANLA